MLNDLAASLFKFWLAGSRHREGQHWLEQAIACDTGLPLLIRSRARGGLGTMLAHQGEYARPEPLLVESLALARECGDPNRLTEALLELGMLSIWQGNLPRALAAHVEAEQVGRAMASPVGLLLAGMALRNQGHVLVETGDLPTAMRRLDASVALLRAPGGSWSLSVALLTRGALHLRRGSPVEATRDLLESIALSWRRHDLGMLAALLWWLAVAAAMSDQPLAALRLLGAADGAARRAEMSAAAAAREHKTIAWACGWCRRWPPTSRRCCGMTASPSPSPKLSRSRARLPRASLGRTGATPSGRQPRRQIRAPLPCLRRSHQAFPASRRSASQKTVPRGMR